jgi:MFS family permease
VQMAVASMLPIFQLEYSGTDPHILNGLTGNIPVPPPGPHGFRSADMSRAFPIIDGAPSAAAVSMLGSLPMLFIGIVNFIAVPISDAIGRRPVMVFCALLNFAMLPWCAKSNSLQSHLAARSIQAFGAGTVEAMVPLVMQDFSFIHERNKFVGLLWASGVSLKMRICTSI